MPNLSRHLINITMFGDSQASYVDPGYKYTNMYSNSMYFSESNDSRINKISAKYSQILINKEKLNWRCEYEEELNKDFAFLSTKVFMKFTAHSNKYQNITVTLVRYYKDIIVKDFSIEDLIENDLDILFQGLVKEIRYNGEINKNLIK
jgi:hypothetical protein